MVDLINNYFGIGNDVSVPIVVSLIVFVLGTFFQVVYKYIVRLLDRKNQRSVFKSILKDTIRLVRASENNTFDLRSKIRFDYSDANWDFKHTPIYTIDSDTFNVNYAKVYSSFKRTFIFCNKKLKREAFRKIWEIFSLLKFIDGKKADDFHQMVDRYNAYKREYDSNIQRYKDQFDDFAIKNRGVKVKNVDEMVGLLDEVWKKWEEGPEDTRTHVCTTYFNVIKPSYDIIRNEHFETAKLLGFDKPIVECMQAQIQIDSLLKSYNSLLWNDYIIYRSSRRLLKKINNII